MNFKCPHVSPCTEAFSGKRFTHHHSDGADPRWSRSLQKQDSWKATCVVATPIYSKPEKGNRHFPTADNRKYVEANNCVSESLFYSLKKPLL